MIHVCFGLYGKTGRYSKFTGTAMLSIFENTASNVTVHILHDNTLSIDNRDKFNYIARQYGQLVKFYNVEELCTDKIKKISDMLPALKTHWVTIGAFYRLLAPQIFSTDIEKIIYLDGDIIVNLDIAELWRIELGDKVLGVIPELPNGNNTKNSMQMVKDSLVNADDYFNTGVMLINLKLLRGEEEILFRGIKFISENPLYQRYMDQDILNYCFSARSLKLPVKFNRFVHTAQAESNPKAEKKIYHYVPKPAAMQMNMRDPFNRLWMKYFMRTPFFDVDTIGRLYEGIQQLHVGLKQSMTNVSAMMSGKTRAFFTSPQSVDAIRKIFSVRADEEIIPAENQTSLQNLIDTMNASHGKKIFFILLHSFPFGLLNQAGFVAGREFVNGMAFLSEAHGVNFNSYPLIKAM